MIQRIQTLWLFLAALVNSGLFMFDLYRPDDATGILKSINVNNNYFFVLIALVTIVLPLVAIFMFRDRKRQKRLAVLSIIACLSFISTMLMKINSSYPAGTTGSYWIGSILPVLAVIFLFMAIRGISKDDKLVRSQDRLR
jgi:peptidoglycan/LPS O-acetylase OafA/YrhL